MPGDPAGESVQTFLDLIAQAGRAHVRRGGPILDPSGPGWQRIAQLGEKRSWLPAPKGEPAGLAFPDGVSSTLTFPVGPEGKGLTHVSLTLKALMGNQRVSLFLDDQNLGTHPVSQTPGRTLTLALPVGGLEPGEHRLRLWFRFARFLGKQRTPGGIGPIVFGHQAQMPAAPGRWTSEILVGGRPVPALLAGAPAAWTFYVWLPEQARFTATAVAGQTATDFRVIVQGDGADPVEAGRFRVEAQGTTDIDLDLDAFARQPVRLVLETDGAAQALDGAGWAGVALRMPAPPEVDVPGARNLLIWTIDGLRADRVGLGRGGHRAATPNLDLMMEEGGAGDDLWSGAATADEGHRRLVFPDPSGPSLPATLSAAGRFTGYFGATPEIDDRFVSEFTTRFDLRRTSEPQETRVLLRELGAWLDVRKRAPFFAYVATTDPRQPPDDAPGYVRLYTASARAAAGPTGERGQSEQAEAQAELEARYDAQVSVADYWIGQMLALLQGQGVLRDTAIIVVGTVGHPLRLGKVDGAALTPDLLRVPVAIWHPGLVGRRAHGVMRGGDLGDVAATALDLAGITRPTSWRGRPLTTSLLFGFGLPPASSVAASGSQVAARLGDWWLRGSPSKGLQLWNLSEDPQARVDLSSQRPIALRLIRDAMQDAPPSPAPASRVPAPR